MKLGFTGTQNGMNKFQEDEFLKLLHKYNPDEFHHGDCIGADKQSHFLFIDWHLQNNTEARSIIIHPPSLAGKMAFCGVIARYVEGLQNRMENAEHKLTIKMLESFPYLERNQHIVDAIDIMVATPKELEHTLRSGTWATIRYSWRQKKQTFVIPPLRNENG